MDIRIVPARLGEPELGFCRVGIRFQAKKNENVLVGSDGANVGNKALTRPGETDFTQMKGRATMESKRHTTRITMDGNERRKTGYEGAE